MRRTVSRARPRLRTGERAARPKGLLEYRGIRLLSRPVAQVLLRHGAVGEGVGAPAGGDQLLHGVVGRRPPVQALRRRRRGGVRVVYRGPEALPPGRGRRPTRRMRAARCTTLLPASWTPSRPSKGTCGIWPRPTATP